MSGIRKPLHQRSDSEINTRPCIRLVSPEPPLLLEPEADISRNAQLSTHPALALSHGKGHPKRVAHQVGENEFHHGSKSQPATWSNASPFLTTHEGVQDAASTTTLSATKRNPRPKKRLVVRVRDNQKTFSLVSQHDSGPLEADLSLSKEHSVLSTRSMERCSNSIVPSESTLVGTPSPKSRQSVLVDSMSSSPWNYQFVGGLRKVPKTPDLKQWTGTRDNLPSSSLETSTAPVKTSQLFMKPSFQSFDSVSTLSENTNYQVYRFRPSQSTQSLVSEEIGPQVSEPDSKSLPSEPEVRPRSLCDSIEDLVREFSSTPDSVIHRPQTSDSRNENYELHGDVSGILSVSPDTSHLVQPQYSHESLVVRPLRTRAHRSNESFGYYKQRSRETLRTAASFTSISTVLSQQEASRAIVGTGSIITLPLPAQNRTCSGSWRDSNYSHPQRSHFSDSQRQWSPHLSTVLSVSDGGTERNSRSWSDEHASRNNNTLPTVSCYNRHLLTSDGLEGRLGSEAISQAPHPTNAHRLHQYIDNHPGQWLGDQDEYEDRITPMQDLRTRPSRKQILGYMSINTDVGRSNTMKSTTSSRANSLLASTIPAWAKLYYASGERKYLGRPDSSTRAADSPSYSFITNSGSPDTDHFPMSIYSPRRRPREILEQNRSGLTQGTPATLMHHHQQLDPWSRRLRSWSMSSMWSPHLRHDRHTTSRVSIWEPPSVNWSTEGSVFGRRNIQIVMFIMGFIFPLSWMIAALLPLPPNPNHKKNGRNHSTSDLADSQQAPTDYDWEFGPQYEARYDSARWWRRLNRCMFLVGVLIISAVIALAVIGTREMW